MADRAGADGQRPGPSGSDAPKLKQSKRTAALRASRTSGARTALADRVIVPPGRAAVVEALASGTTPRGTFLLVTDMGRAYPLSDPELLDVLGYGGVEPVKLPAWLIARVPMGSGLDPAAAMHQS